MKRAFDLCVVFAEMRTGSNHLEALLNAVPGLRGFGEVFNPSFIGRQNQDRLFGYDLKRREADPNGFLQTLQTEAGPDLPVIRLFHDHDPRVLDPIVANPRVAKVILTRNPLDSYISRKIAAETGQWRMTDARSDAKAEVRFDAAEFAAMLVNWQRFAATLRHHLQINGQSAFEIGYDDLGDEAVLNGLLRYLNVKEEIEPSGSTLKPQNPGGPRSKVINPTEMQAALAGIDPFGLNRPSRSDIARGLSAKSLSVLPDQGLIFMPIAGVMEVSLSSWMESLSGAAPRRGLTQRELRQWMRNCPNHRKFSVLRHPLARAHDVFCASVLPRRPMHAERRRMLRRRYEVPLPQNWPDDSYDVAAHGAAFSAFLSFLGRALAGQTSLSPPAEWSGQSTILRGMADFALPDFLIRAERLEQEWAPLSAASQTELPLPPAGPETRPFPLSAIYDARLEALAQKVYRRDYVFFGYRRWSD
ncbi:MAG: nodulation protein NodH [Pseudomonadota bacterium]